MLKENHTRHSSDKKPSQRSCAAAPRVPDCGGQRENDGCANPMNVAVLPHDQPVLLQVGNVVKGRRRAELEKQPSDVCLEKSFSNVVGVVLMIDMLVMRPMFTRPEKD